ncbi:hypothetical protein KXE51_003485 [Salmonella enterica]|nr:hypothetical protein [Salmonella enterica]
MLIKDKSYNPRKLARMLADAYAFIQLKGLRVEFQEYRKARDRKRRAANNLRKHEC